MAMLRHVTAMAARYAIPVQAVGRGAHGLRHRRVHEAACCPWSATDGITRMVRACVDGPVFRGELVRWDDVGTIPFDALGAPGWRRGDRGSDELPPGDGAASPGPASDHAG